MYHFIAKSFTYTLKIQQKSTLKHETKIQLSFWFLLSDILLSFNKHWMSNSKVFLSWILNWISKRENNSTGIWDYYWKFIYFGFNLKLQHLFCKIIFLLYEINTLFGFKIRLLNDMNELLPKLPTTKYKRTKLFHNFFFKRKNDFLPNNCIGHFSAFVSYV